MRYSRSIFSSVLKLVKLSPTTNKQAKTETKQTNKQTNKINQNKNSTMIVDRRLMRMKT